jgi:hypothetical protein
LIEVSAATEAARTEAAIRVILDELAKLGRAPVSREELQSSTRSLVDGFLMRLETRSSLTRLLAEQSSLELREDSYQEHHEALLALTPDAVHQAMAPYFDTTRAVLVVAGDAKTLKKGLSRFGPVTIVDASKDFVTRESVPHDPTAAHSEQDRARPGQANLWGSCTWDEGERLVTGVHRVFRASKVQ